MATFDRLEIAGQLLQPQKASATALLTRPDERWNIAGHVDAAAFALDPFLEKPPFSLRNVALDVQAESGSHRHRRQRRRFPSWTART